LFITWDSPAVSYLEGLFLPIFARLSGPEFSFHVVQFTWGDQRFTRARQADCERLGVAYRAVPILRRPRAAGAMLTAALGSAAIARAVREWGIDLLLPRSTMPALAVLANARTRSMPMLFDADGLPVDERVDFQGLRAGGLRHRLLRRVESRAVRHAAIVTTRTGKAVEILAGREGIDPGADKFRVVTNGRDGEAFSPGTAGERRQLRRQLGVADDSPLVVYAGSVGAQYCLGEAFALFQHIQARKPGAKLLLLTAAHGAMRAELAACPGLAAAAIVKTVPVVEMTGWLAASDVGLALRRPSFSMQGVAPLKMAEYLLCGLPVIATAGVGDTAGLAGNQLGFLVSDGEPGQLEAAADWAIDHVLAHRASLRERCRALGVSRFSLDRAVEDYRRALRSVPLGAREWRRAG
jgi:glycosyltransferase involved in cell wall biosynthesis